MAAGYRQGLVHRPPPRLPGTGYRYRRRHSVAALSICEADLFGPHYMRLHQTSRMKFSMQDFEGFDLLNVILTPTLGAKLDTPRSSYGLRGRFALRPRMLRI